MLLRQKKICRKGIVLTARGVEAVGAVLEQSMVFEVVEPVGVALRVGVHAGEEGVSERHVRGQSRVGQGQAKLLVEPAVAGEASTPVGDDLGACNAGKALEQCPRDVLGVQVRADAEQGAPAIGIPVGVDRMEADSVFEMEIVAAGRDRMLAGLAGGKRDGKEGGQGRWQQGVAGAHRSSPAVQVFKPCVWSPAKWFEQESRPAQGRTGGASPMKLASMSRVKPLGMPPPTAVAPE